MSELKGQGGSRHLLLRMVARVRIGHLGQDGVDLQVASFVRTELHSFDLFQQLSISLCFSSALLFRTNALFLISFKLFKW